MPAQTQNAGANHHSPETNSRTSATHRVTLTGYDILGREIATLVNEEKPPGEYEVEFKAAGLPSGVYMYRLSTGKNFETKKMILLR